MWGQSTFDIAMSNASRETRTYRLGGIVQTNASTRNHCFPHTEEPTEMRTGGRISIPPSPSSSSVTYSHPADGDVQVAGRLAQELGVGVQHGCVVGAQLQLQP